MPGGRKETGLVLVVQALNQFNKGAAPIRSYGKSYRSFTRRLAEPRICSLTLFPAGSYTANR
jgi:hypothetical protein